MLFKSNEYINKHFGKNYFLYFITILFLMIGISAGSVTTKILDATQKKELISFMDSFFKVLNEDSINSIVLLKQSILNNIQTLILIWVLGVVVIGLPIIFGVIILRGFIIGFTVGFLFIEYGFKGFLFSIFSILPQNLFIIPGLIISSVISIGFSISVFKNKTKNNRRYSYMKSLIPYTFIMITTSLIFLIGSFVEAYITPVFMKIILGYMP